MTPKEFYDMWRREGRSPQYIFDMARKLVSLADAEMMEELKRQASETVVTRAPTWIAWGSPERDADGVVL